MRLFWKSIKGKGVPVLMCSHAVQGRVISHNYQSSEMNAGKEKDGEEDNGGFDGVGEPGRMVLYILAGVGECSSNVRYIAGVNGIARKFGFESVP